MTSAHRPGEESRRPTGAPDDQAEKEPTPAEAGRDAKLSDTETNASSAGENESAAAVDADLDALIADVKRERDEYLEIAQRTRADFDNYRKRAARDAQDAERRGKGAIARELLPALDNLERALRAAGVDPGDQGQQDPADPVSEEVTAQQALARGVALVLAELRGALERAGVETYDPVGERFDPADHEALAVRVAGDVEPGVVIETLEKGYRLDGQVLRAARVVVSE